MKRGIDSWTRETASRSVQVPQHRSALEKRFRELDAMVPDRSLSRLFLCASHTLYAIYVNRRGARLL